ncbi:GvpL/GvpF family gas vesicle protein [Streptacidiphilus sp. ASG 303]|uniref:GvpL/GvpF family gas vesicle protein n=1 Tax=Streptacidiphilus sp. ASG 303 TaxID=2896847 RepID=UPI001E41BAC8|nr:GvpL/GvpF family gas vesicle protein [Streptacidiphilus sp. ASG 303]MCD0485933.1 GvpL/GvpF family gas vesicle protein [Streptacidiphilus sp. ASG 303]
MTDTAPAPATAHDRPAAAQDGPATAHDRPDRTVATWVFAVGRAYGAEDLAGAAGLSAAPVRPLAFAGLTAVVQDVPAALFGREALTERLSDPGELERCARAHHAVVTAAAACGPTVPMALATLYLGDERARAALTADAGRFRTALERVGGRVEWGVKVYARPDAAGARPGVPAGGVPGPDAPGAGRAYLERMRGVQRAREEGRSSALRTAEEVHAALSALAVAARRLRPHGPGASGERRTQVLNAAYLLPESGADRIAAAVEELRGRAGAGVDIETSGPWVPYSFAGEA